MQIELRNYRYEDIPYLANLANNPNVSKYLRDIFPYPYLENDAANFIEHIMQLPLQKGIELAITVDGHFAGAIGISFEKDIYRFNGELGYWLGEPFWNHGILTKAVNMMITHIFDKYPVYKITAEVFIDNVASQRVLEKNGFIKEGLLKKHVYKNNSFHDVLLYGLTKENF